jgi:hypothetical protein
MVFSNGKTIYQYSIDSSDHVKLRAIWAGAECYVLSLSRFNGAHGASDLVHASDRSNGVVHESNRFDRPTPAPWTYVIFS